MLVVTTESIPGYKITKTYGIVRGNSVRAKWFGADILAGFRNLVGGELKEYAQLMVEAREKAMSKMLEDAQQLGANAIVGVRYTTSQISQGAAEILVFGTAVQAKANGRN